MDDFDGKEDANNNISLYDSESDSYYLPNNFLIMRNIQREGEEKKNTEQCRSANGVPVQPDIIVEGK